MFMNKCKQARPESISFTMGHNIIDCGSQLKSAKMLFQASFMT